MILEAYLFICCINLALYVICCKALNNTEKFSCYLGSLNLNITLSCNSICRHTWRQQVYY